ncbi:MAG: energy-coupling factor ABC transporter permease [Desulfovibrionaceae bacterium]
MADALISPAVGGVFWGISAGILAYSARNMRKNFDSSLVPLMGVLGAFVFAAQMINFTIPVTGSSGHLGGGMMLAILLGPQAAFMTIASVLSVQALFFADGGLLALGCNIFNMGFFPCFLAYPFIYKPLVGNIPTQKSILIASLVSSVLGLQLGALSVVLETVSSGISSLPFSTFALLMQPIHLGIGIVEGLITAAVVGFVYHARPEIMAINAARPSYALKKVVTVFAVLALCTGGVLSWFASSHPDGLEWSIAAVTGQDTLEAPKDQTHETLAAVQEKTAIMPDYAFKAALPAASDAAVEAETEAAPWPAVDSGTSTAGIVGGMLTLLLAGLAGRLLGRRKSVTHERH